ncbi:hypothetical protein MRX96_056027 [Rhipicephalus microplus]
MINFGMYDAISVEVPDHVFRMSSAIFKEMECAICGEEEDDDKDSLVLWSTSRHVGDRATIPKPLSQQPEGVPFYGSSRI